MGDVTITHTKPIVFFDLETTGVQLSDRIVELGAVKVHVDQTIERLHYLINPRVPIPKEASEVHGIYDADVADKPDFQTLAKEIQAFFNGCDLGGYNIKRFDIPLLVEELLRAGERGIDIRKINIVDVCSLFHQREPRDLTAAVKFYTGQSHEKAHSALGDVEATMNVLYGQLQKYPDLQPHIDSLHHSLWGKEKALDAGGWFLRGAKHKVYYSRGKHRGKCVEDELNYLDWMKGSTNDIPLSTKQFIEVIHLEAKWREQFRDWLRRTGSKVTIPFLDNVIECLKKLDSHDLIIVVKSGEAAIILRCSDKEPADLLIDCKNCIEYLIEYVLYAISELEKKDLNTARYGLLLKNVKGIAQVNNPEDGLAGLYEFLNTGLTYTHEDFHHQHRFKTLHQNFGATKQMVAQYIEKHDYAAPKDKLRYIYEEGIGGLCLDMELFFNGAEKHQWDVQWIE